MVDLARGYSRSGAGSPEVKQTLPLAVGAAILALLFFRRRAPRRWTYGSKLPGIASSSAGGGELNRDPARLLPSFADTVEVLFQRLRARGFDPVLNEGYRSPERGAHLKSLGYSQTGDRSLHVYGAAVDIISAAGGWQGSEDLWQAMGPIAEDLGLVWGGRWSFYDPAHLQAVAVSEQSKLRSSSEPDELASSSMSSRVREVILV